MNNPDSNTTDKPENRPAENKTAQNKSSFVPLAQASVFAALIIVIQSLGIMPLTGVIVNTVLVTMALTQSTAAGVALCILPSSTAFLLGIVPAHLLPMQPIVIIGNLILFFIHKKFKGDFPDKKFKNFLITAVVASLTKALFICTGGWILLKYFLPAGVAIILKMILMLQFFTALAGSFLAWVISKKLTKMG